MRATPCRSWAICFAAATLSVSTASAADGKLQYNRDIRPILAENCFACHGADSAARKAKLRIDQREAALERDAFIPGKPAESALVERIFSTDPNKLMPPEKSHKKLTAAQKETLKKWIAEGAEYQAHWSFIAPTRPELPKVKNEKWVRNPIDRFILAELEKRGLSPAAEADRRTLARRLSLDLTGLPPEPAEVEKFLSDTRPDAYERFVDHLMDSPQWGEHRGRYWLDAARYADTHGIHFDNFREMWTYREWVINAFNENKAFDQFTIEQLAGDLLPNATLDQKIASGFNRCNITSNEGGLIPEEYLVLYTRDRTETTSQVWMGLTAGCAVCHDHKFDPLSMKDFYSLAAFFNNTTQGAMDGNIPNTPPIITVPKPEDRPRWEAVSKEAADLRAKLEERKKGARPQFDNWVKDAKPEMAGVAIPTTGLVFHATLTEGKGAEFAATVGEKSRTVKLTDGYEWVAGRGASKAYAIKPGASPEFADVGDFDKGDAFTVGVWVKPLRRNQNGALIARMDSPNKYRGWDLWVQADRIGTHIVSAWPDDAMKVVARPALQPNQWTHVIVSYDGSGKSSGVRVYYNGVPQPVDVENDKLQGSTKTNVPLKIGQRHTGERVQQMVIQDLRIYSRLLPPSEAEDLAKSPRAIEILTKAADKRTPQETNELFDWWLNRHDEPYRKIDANLNSVQQEEVTIRSRGTIAHVMQEKPEMPSAFILFRGEYDKRRDPVKAETPKALPAMERDLPRNRLGLAHWLLKPDHPLTARVTVNRFWQELFGTGIVRTSGDFGVTGEAPSHPELLDWLAVEFREKGWNVKQFFKLLVTSATYRQAAVTTPEKREKDRDNRLLSRGPRFRMDAEMIRDYALASSGLLVRKLGGPSVKPYMPEGVWEAVAMIGSNTRDYRRDTGENLYRRSMYTFWKRSAPPAQMEILNAPNRETCAVRRERTNTPLQALLTLNDVQFVEAARHLAQRAMKEGGDTFEKRIELVSQRLLTRSLRAEEIKIVKRIHDELLAHYKAQPEEAKKLIAVGESKADATLDASTLAAWTMLANKLMNLDEVLNK